jgi:hypothetical protein
MSDGKQFTVYGDNGLKGTMFANARFLDDNAERIVRLDNGQELRVPADALEPKPDGSFYLRLAPSDLPGGNHATKNGGGAGLNEPLFREGYDVEHVKVDRLIDEPEGERREGDALVLPVIEEVLVVEKKYLLKEEIWIRKKREQLSHAQTLHRNAKS